MSDLLQAAKNVSDQLWAQSDKKLPNEILVLNADTVAIVADHEGVDYILTMARVPNQRKRPTTQ